MRGSIIRLPVMWICGSFIVSIGFWSLPASGEQRLTVSLHIITLCVSCELRCPVGEAIQFKEVLL